MSPQVFPRTGRRARLLAGVSHAVLRLHWHWLLAFEKEDDAGFVFAMEMCGRLGKPAAHIATDAIGDHR